MSYTATYSPEDNKLRIYGPRFDAETYERVKAAGFRWAPKQELWVAPAWTPEREDLCLELAGEVGDEDTSLVDRAEERADRFEDYRDKRAQDAEAARRAVSAIADNIPFGQPILVGHHSEKHARKDAERIENGMRRAVKMWKTSEYWTQRAAGAIRHAKYKELPSVRARRIKGLEADERKALKNIASAEHALELWTHPKLTPELALKLAGSHPDCGWLYVAKGDAGQRWTAYDVLRPEGERYKACPAMTLEDVQAVARRVYPRTIAHQTRWVEHTRNRLAYERAMLAEAGGTVADRTKPEKGGGVRCWATGGRRGPGTFSWVVKVNRVSVTVYDNWGNGGANFTRTIPFDKLTAIISRADVAAAKESGRFVEFEDKTGFVITERSVAEAKPEPAPKAEPEHDAAAFEAMQATLRAGGVQVVSAPQLFPTPPDLAERMAELADVQPGHRVLEPSAGTGNLLRAALDQEATVLGVEINQTLVDGLRAKGWNVERADFLTCNGDLGTFDRILMNPPFKDAEDVKHIMHARNFLRPGGKLVAICANGPRQQAALRPLAESWEELPAGTFDGTGVRAVLLTITGPREFSETAHQGRLL
jgi:protein-L-isoaspartate O-methyltransferase